MLIDFVNILAGMLYITIHDKFSEILYTVNTVHLDI